MNLPPSVLLTIIIATATILKDSLEEDEKKF